MQQGITSPEASPIARRLQFEFTGKGAEFFRIWIVNTVLTVLTLGIYSAWAKVRTQQYFYGNTVLDNARFSYLADPKKILYGRLIAVSLFAIYYAAWEFFPAAALIILAAGCLLLPFFITSSMSFKLRNSAYRHIRFDFKKSFKTAYKTLMIPLVIALATTGVIYYLFDAFGLKSIMEKMNENEDIGEVLLESDVIYSVFILSLLPFVPWLDFLRIRFIVEHASYGKTPLQFSALCRQVYGVYFAGLMVMLFAMFIAYVSMHALTEIQFPSLLGAQVTMILSVGSLMLFVYFLLFCVTGIFKAVRTNLIHNHINIGGNQLISTLNGLKIGWIYFTNTIAILLTLGLFIPWAKVRIRRYIATATAIDATDIDSIRAGALKDEHAFGEEIGDVFDLDLGL